MNSEKPHSLRGLTTRMVFTLVGLIPLLYVLGIGPATYVAVRSNNRPLVDKLYAPVWRAIYRTPREMPAQACTIWWAQLAGSESEWP